MTSGRHFVWLSWLLVAFLGACPGTSERRTRPLETVESADSVQAEVPGLETVEPGPVVVLLHGYASKPEDWLQFVPVLPPGARVIFPRAPEQTVPPDGPLDGRAWWRIELQSFCCTPEPEGLPDMRRASPAGLLDARSRVIALLDRLEREGVPRERVVLGGFSQGAIVAMDVVLHDRTPPGALAFLSGTPVNESEWAARLPQRRGLKVLATHGQSDRVLSFTLAQAWQARMASAGLDVRWVPFEGGHEMGVPAVEALTQLIREVRDAPPRR